MDHLTITQIIERLERGRDSVHHIRDLLNQHPGFTADHDDQGYHKGLDDHSMVALTALDYALSMLHHPDNFSLEENQFGNSKSHDSAAETPRKDRRGCYKRRRNVESVVVDTTAPTEDGFAWRKYGQKVILNSTHPRNYYRCTHKTDQGCQATKQVQQISENPTKYRIIYHGKHTCKNPLKIPSFFINSTTPENPDSSVYLSFETNISAAKQRLNPPSPSNFPFSNSMVKPEYEPIKEETQSEPSDRHDHHQDNSSPSSPDPTTTTSRSEISSGEVYSSVASPHEMDMGEDCYRLLMAAETVNLDQLFQSLRYT